MLHGFGRHAHRIEDAASATVDTTFVDFAGTEFGIHQPRPGVHGGEREEDGDEGAAIFDDDHDAVAGADAEIVAEPGFGFFYDGVELLGGPGAGGFDQRGMIGSAFDPGGDDVAEARREGVNYFGDVDVDHLSGQFEG